MPTHVHLHDGPDRAVIGTVGPPGARTYYLQARTGSRVTAVALEEELSWGLAEAVDTLLDDLGAHDGRHAAGEVLDDGPLDEPVQQDFRMGQLRLLFDESREQVVLEAYPMIEAATEEEAEALCGTEPPEALHLRLSVGAARAFAERTRRVVTAGRPSCWACGEPIGWDEHTCPEPGEQGERP